MKKMLATFAILVALSSTFECEAKAFFFFRPVRFEYNQDKTNDHASKTLSYSSPLTGKRYNFDYRANWNFQPPPMPTFQPITLTIPHPASVLSMFKPLNFNANWDYNFGATKNYGSPAVVYGPPSTTTPSPPPQLHTLNKQFNWDLNWNFNHGSNLGAVMVNHEKEEAPVTPATTTTTTTTTIATTPKAAEPVSNNIQKNILHQKRINLEWSLNLNHGTGTSSSSSPSSNDAPSSKLEPPNKPSSTFKSDADDDFDDELDDDASTNDANNESTR